MPLGLQLFESDLGKSIVEGRRVEFRMVIYHILGAELGYRVITRYYDGVAIVGEVTFGDFPTLEAAAKICNSELETAEVMWGGY